MELYLLASFLLSLALLAIAKAFASWKKNRINQEAELAAPITLNHIPSHSHLEAWYVATTYSGRPLERISAFGLGPRGKAQLVVSETGIEIHRTGEQSFLIPTEDLSGISSASSVIDRAVEKNGLVVITWKLGQIELATYLRVVSKTPREFFINQVKAMEAKF